MTRMLTFAICLWVISFTNVFGQERKPNIIIIYADDLGYGDIGVNGAIGVETPNIDQMANEGVNFTDAHCSAATCTPSRFSLLTGSYAFQNNAAVLSGNAPLIIDPKLETLPSMLKKAGYTTGVVGKWHLGLGNGKVDWNQKFRQVPTKLGLTIVFLFLQQETGYLAFLLKTRKLLVALFPIQ